MYLIEQLEELTGYSKNTIYSLSVALDIKPIRGKIVGKQGKGLYTQEDLDKLLEYKDLISQNYSKEDAYAEVLSHRS